MPALLAAVLAACGAPSEEMAATSADDTRAGLANATISGVLDEPITLSDGQFVSEAYVDGAASRAGVVLIEDSVAYGDLDGQPGEEAVAQLVLNTGGSGAYTYLTVLGDGEDGMRSIATVRLGDRIDIRSLYVIDGRLLVETTEHGPDDAMCCPSVERRREYTLGDGGLDLAANAPAAEAPGPQRFRGHVAIGHERREFTECGTERQGWLFDLTKGDLRGAYEELTALPYEPLFVEVVGVWRPAPNRGFAGDYGVALTVVELRRAEREGFGCDEKLEGIRFRALGNEPSWALEVRDGSLTFSTLAGGQVVFDAPAMSTAGRTTNITASIADEPITVRLDEQRCTDSMSGSRFPYTASVIHGGETYSGCALEGL